MQRNLAARRCFDFLVSGLALCILWPLFLAIAILIKADSPGTVFFRGVRVGRKGKEFKILKFRTMADARPGGAQITVKGDPRITQAGRLLRKLKLDELPQLVNVLRGEMSLVGPRPEDPKYVAIYDARQKRLLEVRPGITSPASLLYRDEASLLGGEDWEQVYTRAILPRKLDCDLAYMEKATLWSDLRVIAQTIGLLSFGQRKTGKSE
jgi:lipopolysaccharide/colanic/teichoic acid biosynthesis glycosyltransferase